MPLAYGIGGLISVPQGAVTGQGAPAASFIGQLGQQYFDTSTSPPTEYVFNGQTWAPGGDNPATTTSFGSVRLATLSQLQNGNAPAGAIVPLSNDVATVIQGVVVGAVPPATELQAGIAKLSTAAQAIAGVDDTTIMTPLKVFDAIGGGSGTGVFSTLHVTGTSALDGKITGLASAAIATGGTTMDLGFDASADAINIGTAAARTITIGSTSATALNLRAGTTWTANGAAGTNYAIGASTTTGTITIGGTAQSTGAITLGSSTAANSVLIQNGTNTGAQIVSIANGPNNADSTVNILNGAAISGTQLLNIMSNTAASTAQRVDILNGANTNTTNTVNIAGAGATGTKVTVNIGTGAAPHVLNLGTTNGAAATTMLVGSGNFSLDGITTSTYAIGASTTTGTITIGGTAMTGAGVITLGSSSAASTVKIASGAGASKVTIGEGIAGANEVDIINGNITAVGTVKILSGIGTAGAAGSILQMANNARVATIDLGNIAPTASRTTTVSGGTIIAAITDTLNLGTGGATTNAGATKTVNVNTGGVTLGSVLTNIATGAVTSGTHTTAIATGNRAGGTMTVNLLTGTGTKTFSAGNADGNTTFNFNGVFNLNASQNSNTAINTGTSTGTIGIGNSLAGAITVATAAGVGIDAATASHFTVTGALADLTLSSVGGSVNITGTEAAVDAVAILASDAAGGVDITAGTGGIDLDTTGAFSIDGATASNVTVTGAAADLTLQASGGSVNILASEAAADAIVINASDAAGGIQMTAGTNSIKFSSGQIVKITSKATVDSGYVLLGSDYFVTTNSTGGAMSLLLPAAPVTGQHYVIYDGAGTSTGGNLVTIDGNGKNIASGGSSAATKTLATVFSSMDLVYNGTLWCGRFSS